MHAVDRQEVRLDRQRRQTLRCRRVTGGRVREFAVGALHLEAGRGQLLEPVVKANLETVPEDLSVVIDGAALHGAGRRLVRSIDGYRHAVAAIVHVRALLEDELQAKQEVAGAGTDLDGEELIVVLAWLVEGDLLLPEDLSGLAFDQLLAVW